MLIFEFRVNLKNMFQVTQLKFWKAKADKKIKRAIFQPQKQGECGSIGHMAHFSEEINVITNRVVDRDV